MLVSANRPSTQFGLRIGVRLAAACLLLFALCCACVLLPMQAFAESPSVSSPKNGATGVSVDIGTINVYFGHNVACDGAPEAPVFSYNQGKFCMTDEDGGSVGISVFRKYFGIAAPSVENPDPNGYRQYLYVAVPQLQPGTSYTFEVLPGVRSEGGHTYSGLTVTFTTAGEKPQPSEPDGGSSGDGDGGGSGGTGSTGDGQDAGGGADAGDGGQGADAGDGTDTGGETATPSSGTTPSASTRTEASSSAQSATEALEQAASAPSAEGLTGDTGQDASAESLAAGIGGGAVYSVGSAGDGASTPAADVVEQVFDESNAPGFLLVIAGCALLGAARRWFFWKKHGPQCA